MRASGFIPKRIQIHAQFLNVYRNLSSGLHTVGTKPGRDRLTTGAHIAFIAPDTDAVARWHGAAVGHGGTDNGPPGLRPEYSGEYFAAFVLDPDGNNVEAVFHRPQPNTDGS